MIVLDTHVLIWLMEGDDRIGSNSRRSIERKGRADEILIAAITPWEIAMLVEKGRLALAHNVGNWIEEALDLPGISIAPLLPAIAVESVRLPNGLNNDPADRMIVATARHHKAIMLTADKGILKYAATGHVTAKDAAS